MLKTFVERSLDQANNLTERDIWCWIDRYLEKEIERDGVQTSSERERYIEREEGERDKERERGRKR